MSADAREVQLDGDVAKEGTQIVDTNEESGMPSAKEEEEVVKRKYGGILPRRPPLISKDHERAYFDSADWALGKQEAHANKPKGPLEALRPKLQPTHQHARSRSAYASNENEDGNNPTTEDMIQSDISDDNRNNNSISNIKDQ